MVIYTFAGFKLRVESLLLNCSSISNLHPLFSHTSQAEPSVLQIIKQWQGEVFEHWVLSRNGFLRMCFSNRLAVETRVNEEKWKNVQNINFHLIIFRNRKGNKKVELFYGAQFITWINLQFSPISPFLCLIICCRQISVFLGWWFLMR